MIKVLIVEDEHPIARAVARLVGQHPACCVAGTESNGEAALQFLRANPVDLVITDIQMPVMTGLELLEAIQAEFPQCLTVVLSGYSQFEYARAALQYRAFDYLLKSVTRENLFRVLDRVEQAWLRQRQLRQRAAIEDALAGEAVMEPGSFHVMIQTRSAQPELAAQYLGAGCHVLNRERDTILVVEAQAPMTEQAAEYFRALTGESALPVDLICTKEPIPLTKIKQTAARLRRTLHRRARLFQSNLLTESRSEQTGSPDKQLLKRMKPERAAEAIRLQQAETLDACLRQMLRLAEEAGSFRADVQKYLDAVFTDSRIAYLLPQEKLLAVREKAWSILTDAPDAQTCAGRLTASLCAIQAETEARQDLTQIVDEIAQQLETSYHLHHSAESLAKQYNFVPGYLNKVFKQYKGVRPSEYLVQIRMNRAKSMLETIPDVLVKDVAASVGYEDPHYFSNIFKRTMGIWPTEVQQTAKHN